ncbi:hypothetical protein B0H21DRAFT_734695 [Amylocystis lapponica]|nr:hypothetical protein B0H21DRAFT_734695 [Amylocystis lapponica]
MSVSGLPTRLRRTPICAQESFDGRPKANPPPNHIYSRLPEPNVPYDVCRSGRSLLSCRSSTRQIPNILTLRIGQSTAVLTRCQSSRSRFDAVPTSVFLDLPVELWCSVISHLPRRSDLAACCLISRAFHREVEGFLYRNVELRGDQIILFHNTIVKSRPDLAFHVKTFSLHLWSDRHLINPILKSLKSLRHLSLFVGGGKSVDYAGCCLRDCTFDLRTFASDFSLTDDLYDFLATQSNLRDWHAKPNRVHAPDTEFPMLPGLTTLHHCGRFTSWISSPQNITHLRLDLGFCSAPCADQEEEEIAQICAIFGQQLVSFVVHQNFPLPFRPEMPPIISYILREAPALKFLAVHEPKDVYVSPRGPSLLEEALAKDAQVRPYAAKTQLDTLVWSPSVLKIGGGTTVNTRVDAKLGASKQLTSASEGVQHLVGAAGGEGDPTSALALAQHLAVHAMATFPTMRKLVLIGETQYMWDAEGVYEPISDVSWKEV